MAVALAGIGTAVITTAGGVLVAWITNRREAETATEEGVGDVLEQRILLRDEQIAALEMKVRNRDDRIARLEQELALARRGSGPHAHP